MRLYGKYSSSAKNHQRAHVLKMFLDHRAKILDPSNLYLLKNLPYKYL